MNYIPPISRTVRLHQGREQMHKLAIVTAAALALVACEGVYGPNDARVVGAVPAQCVGNGALPAASNGPECNAPTGARRVGSLFVKAE